MKSKDLQGKVNNTLIINLISYIAAKRCEEIAKTIMYAGKQQNSQVPIQEYPKLLTESKALLTHIGKILGRTPNLKRIEEYGKSFSLNL